MSIKDDNYIINDTPALLCTLSDGSETDIAVSLLESNDIPVMTKRRAAGEYLKIYMGMSFYEVDIYVPSKLVDKASEILSGEPVIEIEEIEEDGEADIPDKTLETFTQNKDKNYENRMMIWGIRIFFVIPMILWLLWYALNAIFTFFR